MSAHDITELQKQVKDLMDGVLMTMEERGCQTYMVGMNKQEVNLILDMVEDKLECVDWIHGYKEGHEQGYEQGYQQAIKDMGKRIKEMRTFGGDKQEKRADGMPEHHAGRTADMQRKLQRAGTEEGDGGSLGAMPAKGGHT